MSKETENFISKNAGDVIKSVQGTGFFPSLKMAQMIIESSGKDEHGKFGIGKGLAVRKAGNYFGIKADKRWNGKRVALSTPKDGKPVSLFRVYPSILDSLKDHTQFLLNNSRYKQHGVFVAKTPQVQAEALQQAGYSESPTYSKALVGIIKAYHLEQLDGKKITDTQTNAKPFILIGGTALLLLGAYYYREEIKTNYQKLIA
jgi:N-acetylmuramoyl-L-alanine amidase